MTTQTTDTTGTIAPPINLLDPLFYVDPWEAYRWLRENSPVHWDPVQRIWGISLHADIQDIETNPGLYTSFNGSRPHTDQSSDFSMINLDDPDHQRQRRLVLRRFTPRAVRNHEAEVRALADRIIDEATAGRTGTLEAVEAVASRLPAMEITNLLGYPPEQWELIREVSEITMHDSAQNRADGRPSPMSDRMSEVMTRWAMATMEVMAARRAEPRDDLISIWVHSETDGEPWSDERVLQECILLVDGGAETTRTTIGAMIRELALRPDMQQRLRQDTGLLWTTGIDEFIRWVSPVLNMRRTVTQDHELHGQRLQAGDEVLLMYASANRDPRAFDRPDDFDPARDPNHHLGLGIGTHFCLGANLARLELRVIFEHLLTRLPQWQLIPGTDPQIMPATFARAYDAVQIEFDPRAVREAA